MSIFAQQAATESEKPWLVGLRDYSLTTVGLTVAACGRLSGYTPEEAGIPDSDVRMLTLYS